MERAVLDVMNAGLRALEPHPLFAEPPTVEALRRFEAHTLVFARAFGRLLERRVARNLDRDEPRLATTARVHLRIHQPFPRALEAHLQTDLGQPRAELDGLELAPAGRAIFELVEGAFDARDVALTHVLMLQGLECLTQYVARRGAELTRALGGNPDLFEDRHDGHETLLFMGLERLRALPEARTEHIAGDLETLFVVAGEAFDAWVEGPPPSRPPGRERRRKSRWGTGDLPIDAA